MTPSGQQLRLEVGPYAAVITEVGASLRRFTHRGRPVTLGYEEDQRMQRHRGAVLVPWPNRVGDGRYAFGGESHQLPITEVERQTALHGLVCWHAWNIVSSSASTATLATRVW